jgi:putative MATE family efflux protein
LNKRKYGLDLTQGRISALLPRFAWPFIASGIMSALYGAVDLFVIGYFTPEEIISGVSTGTQVLMIVYTFTIALGTGGTVLVGRRMGERDDAGCARAAGTFMTVGLIAAAAITAAIALTASPMLTLLRTPELARPSAMNYVLFAAIGIPFNFGYSVISAIARGLGNAKVPSIVGGLGAAANIVLDFLFVGAFGWAEMGVALATSLSQLLTFVVIGAWLLKRKFPFPFAKRDFKPHAPSAASIFKVGIPLWMQEILVHISFMIITGIVNDMGVVESAAVGLIAKVFSLVGLFPMAISNAVAAIAAQNLGAMRRDRAIAATRWGIFYSLVIELIALIACQAAPDAIMALFANGKPEVIAGAAAHLRSFSIDLLLISFVFNLNAYLSSCGKSNIAMLHSMVSTFAVRVPLSLLFAGVAGTMSFRLFMLGFAAPIASLPSIAICIIYIAVFDKKRAATEKEPARS